MENKIRDNYDKLTKQELMEELAKANKEIVETKLNLEKMVLEFKVTFGVWNALKRDYTLSIADNMTTEQRYKHKGLFLDKLLAVELKIRSLQTTAQNIAWDKPIRKEEN